MKRNAYRLFVTLTLLLCYSALYAQPAGVSTIDSLNLKYLNWYNLNPQSDRIEGTSVNKAYAELLAGKTPRKKIVVAVIDGGVDITHPDLKGKIWTNPREIAGNGLDDDNNGYADDIHGWNFIGNKQGENLLYEHMEFVRIYKSMKAEFGNITQIEKVAPADRDRYKLFDKCRAKYDDELKKHTEMNKSLENFEAYYKSKEDYLKRYLRKDKITEEDIKAIKSKSKNVNEAKKVMLDLYKKGFTYSDLAGMRKRTSEQLNYYLNLDFDPRKLVGDNPDDITDVDYGNADVKGPRSFHGTFVSGIITANRNNGIGTDGIAENVEIMVLRAVPDGDERDKDIALAIRYAVDNGANIINMSFGKYFSVNHRFMEEAIQYADNHNVLMIHSAGNASDNLDLIDHYPSSVIGNNTFAKNWITVGATTDKADKNFCGVFSNYGTKTVDLFAPGVNIISLFPENAYKMGDGTSYSGPVVAGIAALVWSYYPELSAQQLKDILLNSATNYPKLKVYIPDTSSKKKTKTAFSELSTTGGVVNAYNALKLAGETAGK
ncbi:MAG: subtilisin-like serine [Bacteroidetes bacterium]|nr:MAG: subtilisin-like serine [Bacteroidota bacterium]